MDDGGSAAAQVLGGDIWSGNFGFTFASSVHDILERESFTLGDLLEEDEVLQEVKGLDAKLIDFLCRPETVTELLSYLADPIPADASDARRYKYPYMACEIVCCEVDRVLAAIAEQPSHLAQLLSMLDQPPGGLDHRHAGYLEEAFAVLLKRCRAQAVGAVNAGGAALFVRFLAHAGSFSVVQVLRRLLLPDAVHVLRRLLLPDAVHALVRVSRVGLQTVALPVAYTSPPAIRVRSPMRVRSSGGDLLSEGHAADAHDEHAAAAVRCTWTQDPAMLELLVGALTAPAAAAAAAAAGGESAEPGVEGGGGEGAEPADVPSHLADLLLSIVEYSPADSKLLQGMCSSSTVGALAQTAAAGLCAAPGAAETEYALAALRVLQALAVRLSSPLLLPPRAAAAAPQSETSSSSGSESGSDDDGAAVAAAAAAAPLEDVAEALLPRLCACLRVDAGELETCCGERVRRVGPARLACARFVRALVALRSARVDAALAAAAPAAEGALAALLDAFFAHEQSSLLHQAAAGAIVAALQGDAPARCALQRHLFEHCHLLTRIRDAVAGNAAGEAQGLRRRGYMAHVLQISEELARLLDAAAYDAAAATLSDTPAAPDHKGDDDDCGNNGETAADSAAAAAAPAAAAALKGGALLRELVRRDACAAWWDAYVGTTLARALSVQATPIGGFAVPVRDAGAPLAGAADFDDGHFDLTAMIDQFAEAAKESLSAGGGGGGLVMASPDDAARVFGFGGGGGSDAAAPPPPDAGGAVDWGSGRGVFDSGGGDGGGTGWANFADFGAAAAAAPPMEAFADFDAAFGSPPRAGDAAAFKTLLADALDDPFGAPPPLPPPTEFAPTPFGAGFGALSPSDAWPSPPDAFAASPRDAPAALPMQDGGDGDGDGGGEGGGEGGEEQR
ncbi:hypothetical protein JKP88DRAFT_325942 [Tribonema minus]|uniref:Uncharacterized protein n=1 Tax=Tribonema minus TaxID=303371 RepID=A0A835YR29_9STRA|nr:hypothetical protein JKP88DRAFT_325942 [Tribonema minus]